MTAAVVIFVLAYLGIAGQRLPFTLVDRPAAALCGAVAMVAFGVLSVNEAYAAVHLDTLLLLLGMMLIAAYLTEAAFFRTTAWLILTHVRTARRLLWALSLTAAGLSALLVNDTVCLMFTPLVVALCTEAKLPPLPYLLALACASNVGSAATFTGNPQNMMIGSAATGTLDYLTYAALAAPVALLGTCAVAALLCWLFRRELPHEPLPAPHLERPPFRRWLALKGVLALALFVGLAASGFRLAGAAMTAAALLVLVARVPPRGPILRIDWVLLLFFAGLFVVVHGLAASGALERGLEPLRPLLAGEGALPLVVLGGLAVIGSNLVSNVPFVLVALHWVPTMREPRWGYVVLALASTLAGNLTVFGSMANIIVLEGAGPHGKVGFARFLRYGAVVTAATLAIAAAVVAAERALGLA